MENASKALVMAGGILIAILVVGALLLMVNQIGSYEKAQTTNVKDSQLAQFNYDFERYTDDEITGADIISIINKVNDFNKKDGVTNSVNYDIEMSVTVKNMKNFSQKHANNIFDKDEIDVESFSKIIDSYVELENIYTLSGMSKIYSKYHELSKCTENSTAYKELIEKITGKKGSSKYPSLKEIEQYTEYSEFKKASFVSYQASYYNNGQIQKLYFKFNE